MKRAALALILALSPCAHAEERAIVKEVIVRASPETAWRTWTTKEGIQSFFAPEAIVDPRPEGAFSIHINPFAAPGLKGADGMRFLALQENRMLSFTWNAPPHLPDARRQRTSVVVRFAPAGEGATRVTLHHSGWGEGGQWDQAFDYFDNAWGRVLANFRKRFDEGPVDWTEHLARMKAATPR